MANNEKDVPIKEQSDGSFLAKLEDHVDHFPEEEKQDAVDENDQDEDEPNVMKLISEGLKSGTKED